MSLHELGNGSDGDGDDDDDDDGDDNDGDTADHTSRGGKAEALNTSEIR